VQRRLSANLLGDKELEQRVSFASRNLRPALSRARVLNWDTERLWRYYKVEDGCFCSTTGLAARPAANGERTLCRSLFSQCVCEWNCARHRPIFPWEIEKLPQKEEKGGRERETALGNGENRLESMMGNIGASSLWLCQSGQGSPPSIHHCPWRDSWPQIWSRQINGHTRCSPSKASFSISRLLCKLFSKATFGTWPAFLPVCAARLIADAQGWFMWCFGFTAQKAFSLCFFCGTRALSLLFFLNYHFAKPLFTANWARTESLWKTRYFSGLIQPETLTYFLVYIVYIFLLPNFESTYTYHSTTILQGNYEWIN